MNKQTKALLKENNELEKTLDKETVDILTDIVVYIRGASISEYNQELARRDITNMLIEGQERGETAAEVIGDDYKAFCDAVIAEMPKLSMKDRILDAVQIVCFAFSILIICWFAFSRMISDMSKLPLTSGDVISALLIVAAAFGTVGAVTRFAFDTNKLSSWKLWLLCFAVIFVCILPSLVFRRVLCYVPTIVAAILVMVLLAVYKILDRR